MLLLMSSKLHTCVDLTTVPSGKLMVRWFVAGRIFLIKVPFNTKTDVALVSATVCISGIAGFIGCMQGAHTLICFVVLEVTTVFSSMLTSRFWVGYKVGSETNGFKHFNSTCFAPHHHILGNLLLCMALVHAPYPAVMYSLALLLSNPSW